MTVQKLGEVVFGMDEVITEWVCRRIPYSAPMPGDRALGVYRDGRIIAGVVYQAQNPANIMASIAAIPQSGWASRRTLHALFFYPYVTLGCPRITTCIAQTNGLSLKLAISMGFQPEAILERAAHDGSNLVVLKMFKENCIWIENHEQRRRQRTEITGPE